MDPVVISTWKHGLAANAEAYKILKEGGNSLDAVEMGVKISEDDPDVLSVGYGGLPDCEGSVTLDAAIMDWRARIGSVISLENIKNPISLARLVLENTEHTILAGDGAYDFALKNGFKPESLLTENSIRRYHEWKASGGRKAEEIHTDDFLIKKDIIEKINADGNHDTIGMVAIDKDGHISASCTTSGMAWKLKGRVGDSPVIGSGLYVDGDVGGAASTGRGEECIRACGSFLIVEMMRNGKSPMEACKTACERVYKLNKLSDINRDHIYQVGFVALNLKGEHGAYSVREGFQYALYKNDDNSLNNSDYFINEKFIIEDL
ncbi:MAG TPA: N(4)-(beta-N-acetylglucosaminyl)-L-asparaginase [Ignavibacteria bacterium]|nr:N(4)-(beta-N-acetylglucosaminyl)-L-asparaginase [Ignavibacteria bacterium]HRA99283.1 N(4)-(beta-N-acetylglucosaminyl)-L-asparaginase [Ignavibacteria bacterium]